MAQRTLFLTGSTGLLGNELLRCYLETRQDIQIRVLVRGEHKRQERFANLVADAAPSLQARFAQCVQPVWGDLEAPRLGLSAADYDTLSACVTDIVNCAAMVDFAQSLEVARAVNYHGVVRLYEFARECANLRAFAHVSTAHVAGRRTGWVTEDELEHNVGFVNTYEQSKYEAEQYLRAQMKASPIAVFRTTTLIGNSQTGLVRQFNFFHYAIRALFLEILPALPGIPDGHLDFIPSDFAARAIQDLVDDAFHPGTTYHICAGPARSYTLQGLLDATEQVFNSSSASTKKSVRKPMVVDSAEFDRVVDAVRNGGNGRVLKALTALNYFLPHLSLPKIFDDTHTRRDLAMQAPDIRSYYPRVVEYCLRTEWGRRNGGGRDA